MHSQLRTQGLEIYESALFRTTSTIVYADSYVLIVDPTWLPQEVAFLHQRAESLATGKERYLLFTHSDYDHILGYGQFEGYTTIASRAFVDNPEPEAALEGILRFDHEYYIRRPYPIVYPSIDLIVEGPADHRQLGSDRYEFYPTPGHNPDGILTFNRDRGILIVGDYLSNEEFPYIYDSVARYRDTLYTLERLIESGAVHVLVTGHGDHTDRRTEMQLRLSESRDYLDRLEAHVRTGAAFDLEQLFRRYDFPKGMLPFHEKNVALLRRELAMELE